MGYLDDHYTEASELQFLELRRWFETYGLEVTIERARGKFDQLNEFLLKVSNPGVFLAYENSNPTPVELPAA